MTAELSGVDLARQALVAAREAAKKSGATTKKPQRRTTTVVRRDGREPLGLGSAISRMMTERGMVAPAAGGSVLAYFDTILAATTSQPLGQLRPSPPCPEQRGRLAQATISDWSTSPTRVVRPRSPASLHEVQQRSVEFHGRTCDFEPFSAAPSGNYLPIENQPLHLESSASGEPTGALHVPVTGHRNVHGT